MFPPLSANTFVLHQNISALTESVMHKETKKELTILLIKISCSLHVRSRELEGSLKIDLLEGKAKLGKEAISKYK